MLVLVAVRVVRAVRIVARVLGAHRGFLGEHREVPPRICMKLLHATLAAQPHQGVAHHGVDSLSHRSTEHLSGHDARVERVRGCLRRNDGRVEPGQVLRGALAELRLAWRAADPNEPVAEDEVDDLVARLLEGLARDEAPFERIGRELVADDPLVDLGDVGSGVRLELLRRPFLVRPI